MLVGLVPADPLEQLGLDLSILSLAFLGLADLYSDKPTLLFHVTALEHRTEGTLTADALHLVAVVELLAGVGPVGAILFCCVCCYTVTADGVDGLVLRYLCYLEGGELVFVLGKGLCWAHAFELIFAHGWGRSCTRMIRHVA